MKPDFDVAVVGAGPAGCIAAETTAKQGLRTVIFERRKQVGIPVQCGEFLPTPSEMLDLLPDCPRVSRLVDVPKRFITNETHNLKVVSPENSVFNFSLHANVIDRLQFDEFLAKRAVDAGAELRTSFLVTERSPSNTLTVKSKSQSESIEARIVIGADGSHSRIAKSIGSMYTNPDKDLSLSIQYVMTDVDCNPDTTEMYFGGQIAPGGYAWIIPKGNSTANVGLGLRRTFMESDTSLAVYLKRFIESHPLVAPRMKQARILRRISAVIPVGGYRSSFSEGRVLLAGDAAGHVMASNGGGIPTALAGGELAGLAAASHLQNNTPLIQYEDTWKKEFGHELSTALDILRIADKVMVSDRLTDQCMRLAGARYIKHLIRCRLPIPVRIGSRTIARVLSYTNR